jgi:peptide deformylase
MEPLEIRVYPDPVLRMRAEPVTEFDASLERLVRGMAETMYTAPGVGLAAPQVGVSKRLFMIDLRSPQREDLHVFINPEIVEREGEITWEEGCLSFPDIHTEVERSRRVVIRALDVRGEPFELEGVDLMAVAMQHELDHLDGRLLIDNMAPIDRALLRRRMTRRAIEAAKPI